MAKRGWTILARDDDPTRTYSVAEPDRVKDREYTAKHYKFIA